MFRVAIIGAGPAGSTAATILARAGMEVTLVEQHRFPRDKVCGECLSALGIEVLSRLRLREAVEALGPIELRRATLFSPDGTGSEITLPRPMWGISRQVFDDVLLTAARESGARVIQPARCESRGSPVTIRCLETNRIERLHPDFVLVADGKGSTTGDFGLKAHFLNVDGARDAVGLFGVRGHYGGIAPIEGGRWNIAFSVPARRIRESRGDLDVLFERIMQENAELRRQMRYARRIGEWLVSPLPRSRVQRSWRWRTIPVGNAAASVEPIGGEGMGLAMRSAELACASLLGTRGHDGGSGSDLEQLRAAYRRLWTIRGLACRTAALVVSSPRVACAIAGFVQDDSPLTAAALRLVGKASEPVEGPAQRPALRE
jgi:flavin-dependent dehydrogenase